METKEELYAEEQHSEGYGETDSPRRAVTHREGEEDQPGEDRQENHEREGVFKHARTFPS